MRLKIFSSIKGFFLCFLVLLLNYSLSCQWSSSPGNGINKNVGLKYFRYYNPKIEDVQPQNWCVLQDKRGIIYVANQGGVLEFDGVSWRLIKVPNRSVRSMAIDDAGTIYIGGKSEFGFLAPDAKGSLQYMSLLNHLDENQKNFTEVWKTHAIKEGVYFHTTKFLFRWDSTHMKVWQAQGNYSFNASFAPGGKLFIRQQNRGLMQMVEGSLKLVPGGETFAVKKVYMMTSYRDDSKKLLLGTRDNGFYIYDGNTITTKVFPTEADDYVQKHQLYYGIRLSSGDFALATLRGGLVIIDARGRLKQIYNKDFGLLEDNIKYAFEGSQGNLWIALSKGIAKIEYTSPFSIFDHRLKLYGLVLSVIKHRNHLYVGTDRGLYSDSLISPSTFRPVLGMSSNCWHILSIGESLLAATSGGVFWLGNNNTIKRRVIKNRSYVLFRSIREPNRVWVGTDRGLAAIYRGNSQWKEEHTFENINREIRTIVEDKKGNLWLGTTTEGVLKVNFPGDGSIIPSQVIQFGDSHGLPRGEVHVFTAAGDVIFATDKGIFRFNEKNKMFIPDSMLGDEFADGSREVFRIAEDKNKNIWFHSLSRNFQAVPQPGGTDRDFVVIRKPFLRIPLAVINFIYPDDDGKVVWFGGNDGLIRYDITMKKSYQQDFPVLIRQVMANEKLIFAGYKIDRDSTSKSLFPLIAYKNRNLRFTFAAPFFQDESSTRYQYFLEGYDKGWSDWSLKTSKDYNDLDSGLYRFRVKARNVYLNESQEEVFQFNILLPWYRTWWAFLIYALVSYTLIYLIVKWWRSVKLEKEKQRLEQIVKERTKEINQKNLQLEDQSEKLKEMDKVKSRFFASISHEFRTPLTLIMGPLEQMIPKTQNYQRKNQLNLMLRNSQRLLTLINQLLDLSRFDSGKMRLQAASQDIIPFLKGILASFRLLAAQKKLELEFVTGEENITLYFDPEKMEEAICNLLSNAVKFTRPGGKITVTAKVSGPKAEENKYPAGFLEISVRDTGEGIPKDQLVHIFDRFYQAKGSELRGLKHKGSGIGLALTKELVNLHHGRINVHSREGKGTEFIIRLPRGDRHLKPYEMVSPSEISATHPKSRGISEIQAADMMEEKEAEPVTADVEVSGEGKDMDKEPGIREKNVILVVEDHAEVRDYIRGSLEPQYIVVEAENGRQGINKAKEIIPDLIISDIMMPEVDGYQLCNTLKKEINTSHIPIILLTAKASEESIVHGLKTGADDYITKPFNTKILDARIKNLIDLRRQLQLKIQREKNLVPAEISVSSVDEGFLKEFQDTVEKNLADPDFNIDQLCKDMIMSRATLFRKIYALTGQTPNQFIHSYRLQKAAQLLKANFGNVTEVAFEVGFSSSAYFTKCFKEKYHQLPSTFQASEASPSVE